MPKNAEVQDKIIEKEAAAKSIKETPQKKEKVVKEKDMIFGKTENHKLVFPKENKKIAK